MQFSGEVILLLQTVVLLKSESRTDMCSPPRCLVQPAWFYSWSWNGISNELYSSFFVPLISQPFTNKEM